MNNKIIIFSFIVIFVFSYILWEAYKIDNKFSAANSDNTGTVVKRLPNLEFEIIGNADETITLYEYTKQGKNVFIHFWATWCAPCEKEFPELVQMIQLLKTKSNIEFVLVAVNDDKIKMKKFLKRFDLNLDNVSLLHDSSNAHKQLGTYKLPETFIFNTENEIVKKYTGQQAWTEQNIIDQLRAL